MSTGFLATVMEEARARVEQARRDRSLAALKAAAKPLPAVRSLKEALTPRGRRIIAEVKRASPSKGPINPRLDPAATAKAYQAGGAAAVSVLTEPNHFSGSLEDLRKARSATRLPVLRKDFLVDPWQLWESRVAGADAVLLIVAALPGAKLTEMLQEAAAAGLEALVEVHEPEELPIAVKAGAAVLGVNARNLSTLEVDLARVEALGKKIPKDVIGVAESGVQGRADLARLEKAGYRAFLVGEALAARSDPEAALRKWIAP